MLHSCVSQIVCLLFWKSIFVACMTFLRLCQRKLAYSSLFFRCRERSQLLRSPAKQSWRQLVLKGTLPFNTDGLFCLAPRRTVAVAPQHTPLFHVGPLASIRAPNFTHTCVCRVAQSWYHTGKKKKERKHTVLSLECMRQYLQNLAIQSERKVPKLKNDCVTGQKARYLQVGDKNHKCFDNIFSNRAMQVKCYLL